MNKSDNTYCSGLLHNPELLSKTHMITLVVFNSVISLTTVLTNLMVISAIIRLRQHKKPSHLLLLVLACSDFAVGLVSNTSLTIMLLEIKKPHGCFRMVSLLSLFWFPLLLSVSLTTFECIERIIHIRFIEFYTKHISRTKIILTIVIGVMYALCFGTVIVFSYVYDFFSLFIQVTISLDISFYLALTLAYFKAYKGLRQRIRDIQWTDKQRAETNWEDTLTKNVFYFIIFLWIAWGPYCVIAFIKSFKARNDGGNWEVAFLWVFVSFEFNSTLNALSVLTVNKRLRKCVKARFSSSTWQSFLRRGLLSHRTMAIANVCRCIVQ